MQGLRRGYFHLAHLGADRGRRDGQQLLPQSTTPKSVTLTSQLPPRLRNVLVQCWETCTAQKMGPEHCSFPFIYLCDAADTRSIQEAGFLISAIDGRC